jgi:hypothetical protein
LSYINKCKENGDTICETEGYNMLCDEYPKYEIPIIDQVKYGAFSKRFSKTILFDPNQITELNASPGAHVVEPEGNVRFKKSDGLKLLHYKCLGGLDRLKRRWDVFGVALSAINKQNGWATNRSDSKEIVNRWREINEKKVLVVMNYSYQLFFDWFKRKVINRGKELSSKNNF